MRRLAVARMARASASSCISRSAAAGRRRAGRAPAARRMRCRRAPSRAARVRPRRSPPPARSRARRAARASAPLGALGATNATQLALVGDVHRIDPEQLSGARDRGCDRHVAPRARARRRRAARQLVERGGDAAAGGVAHAVQIGARGLRAARRRPATASACPSGSAASQLEFAAREHDRHAVFADRAGDEHAVAGPQTAGATARAARVDRSPTPVVQTYMPSAWPCSTTLVSPAIDLARRPSRAARATASTPRAAARRPGPPRARARASARAAGRPTTARSLTVPLTASSPIEPPGKRSGVTTKLSVVTASAASPSVSVAGVGRASPAARCRSAGRSRPSISACDGLAARAVRHRDLLVAQPRALGARAGRSRAMRCSARAGAHRALTASRRRACGRSCSRRRRRPRARPCTRRSAARACTPCRRRWHSHGLITPLSTSPHWHALRIGHADARAPGSGCSASSSA